MTQNICLFPCYSLRHPLPFFSSRSSHSSSPCRTAVLGQLLLSQANGRFLLLFCAKLWVGVAHIKTQTKKKKKKKVLKLKQNLSTFGEGEMVFWENAIAVYSICASI